jgi:hypothetical protein
MLMLPFGLHLIGRDADAARVMREFHSGLEWNSKLCYW